MLAQNEARRLSHDHVGTEHILLGLIAEGEGVAAKALESLGISLSSLRPRVEEMAGRGERAPDGPIPFSPGAKTVLQLSLTASRQLGHRYIGTEHILLGLLDEADGIARQVLLSAGAYPDKVRQQVVRLLAEHQRPSSEGR